MDTQLKATSSHSAPMKVMAQIVSYMFHPVLLPPMIMAVLYIFYPFIYAGMNKADLGKLFLIVTLNTTFFSVVFVLICKGLGLIKSLQMHSARERIIPLLGIMVFYFWCNHVMANIPHVPFAIRLLVLGGFWCVIGMFLVNIFYKVSLHTTGAGAAIAYFAMLLIQQPMNMIGALLASIIIAGVVGSARMIAGSHKTFEIVLGYFLGAIIQIGAYYFLL